MFASLFSSCMLSDVFLGVAGRIDRLHFPSLVVSSQPKIMWQQPKTCPKSLECFLTLQSLWDSIPTSLY